MIKPLVSGKMVNSGETDNSFNDELKKSHIWGMEAGFASEYFISEHFSIGGEFGLRFAFYKYKNDELPSVLEKVNLNMSYVNGSLNFYF